MLQQGNNILDQLFQQTLSLPFRTPVNTAIYTDYLLYVKKPMDLSTLRQNWNKNVYSGIDELAEDIRLMFKNCYAYNMEGSALVVQAKQLEAFFETLLESDDAADQQPKLGGLTLEEYENARDMLIRLTTQPNAYFFTRPVDPLRFRPEPVRTRA